MSSPNEVSQSSSLNATAQREAEWERGLSAGRFDIYREIFQHDTPILIRFARLSVPVATAEDIVQDVMLNLWIHRQTISTRQRLSLYLFGAVKKRLTRSTRIRSRRSKCSRGRQRRPCMALTQLMVSSRAIWSRRPRYLPKMSTRSRRCFRPSRILRRPKDAHPAARKVGAPKVTDSVVSRYGEHHPATVDAG